MEQPDLALAEHQQVIFSVLGQQREQRLEVKAAGYDEHIVEGDRQAIRPEKTVGQEYGQAPALKLPEGFVGYEGAGRFDKISRVRPVHTESDQFLLDRSQHIIEMDRVLPDLGPGRMCPEIKGNAHSRPLPGQQFKIVIGKYVHAFSLVQHNSAFNSAPQYIRTGDFRVPHFCPGNRFNI